MIEGLPSLPELVFVSGDRCYLIRDVPLVKRGIDYRLLYMILEPAVKTRYGIKDEELDYNITIYGCYKKEYPAEYMKSLSTNPENPIYLMLCGFDGSDYMELELAQLKAKINRQSSMIRILNNENDTLRLQLKQALERLRLLESGRGDMNDR